MGRHDHGANSEHIVNHRKVHHHHHDSGNHHRARSLSPHRYRKQLNQPHRHSHHRFHHHHHRDRSPSPRHRTPSGSPNRRRSSPPPRRRSPAPSPPRRDLGQRRRFRRRSVSPRARSRREHRRRRRASSSERHSDRTPPSSPSPSPRSRAGRGNLARHILRLLTSSKKKKHHEEEATARDTSFHSLDARDPHSVSASRSQNDLLPLILAQKDLTDLASATMARHNFGRNAALQRAREDEAMEVERLRKIREDAAEAERLRISTEEAAERARRTRIQMEMDEAEMRRVRALEQFNETERQRRELHLEDRLRQLEDQEMPPEPQKTGSCKKYCRAFKVSFGIFLSLGLIFVFYLIVASIMGESAPLDIFNLDQTEDPSLADVAVRDPGKNITGQNNFDNSIEGHKSEEKTKNSNKNENENKVDNVGSDFDNVVINPYDTSRAYDFPKSSDQSEYGSFDDVLVDLDPSDGQITRDSFGNLIIEPFENESKDGAVIVEYIDDSPIKNEETISVVALEPGIPYTSDDDQQLSPSNPADISYLPPFVASNEDHFANGNFESVHRDSDHFIARQFPPNMFESPATPSSVTTTFDEALLERSDTNVGEYDYFLPPIHINGPIQTSFEDRTIERRNVSPIKDFSPTHIPNPVFAHSYEDSSDSNRRRSFETIGGGGVRVGAGGRRGERRPSLEKLESEIIETLLNIAEKDKSMTNRRLRVRPGASSQRRLRGQNRRMEAPSSRRRRVDPTRRTGSRPSRPTLRLNSMRARQRQRLPLLPLPDIRTASQSPAQLGTYRGPPLAPRVPASEDPMKGMENSRRVQYSSHRGPRNTEAHVPPPEFRYPKSAENIQDIISHMTEEGSTPKVAFSRQRRIPKGFKIGHQGHVLKPTFIKSSDSRSKERRLTVPARGRKVRRKTKPKLRAVLKTKPKIVRIKQDDEDEVIFNDDGSVVHISNNPPPLQYAHSVEIPPNDKEPPQSRDHSAPYKDYSPPVYDKNKSKVKPIKVMLDVYPSPNYSGEDGTPRYESKYYLEDKYSQRPIGRDNFRQPGPYPSSRELYDDENRSLEEGYRSSDKRYRSSGDRYRSTDESYRSPDDRYKSSDEPYRSSDDRYKSSDKPYRSDDRYKSSDEPYRSPDDRYQSPNERSRSPETPRYREPYYNSREKYPNSEYRHVPEDSGYDRSRVDDKLPSIQTSDNQHTITLHINLYDRKPDYHSFSSRISPSASVLRPTHMTLSDPKFPPGVPTSGAQLSAISSEGRRPPADYKNPALEDRDSPRSRHSSPPEPDPTDPEVKLAMKELGINIDLKKRFSALDVYRALIRNTRKMRRGSNFRFGKNGGPVAAGLTTSKSLDEEEEVSLLSTVHDALEGINLMLPKALQFELPKSEDSSPQKSRYKALVAKLDNDDFDYSDGFEAVVDDDTERRSEPRPAFSRRMGKFMNVSTSDVQLMRSEALGDNVVESLTELPGFDFTDPSITSNRKNLLVQTSNSDEDESLSGDIPSIGDGFHDPARVSKSEISLDSESETGNTAPVNTEPIETTTKSVHVATVRPKFHLKTIIE